MACYIEKHKDILSEINYCSSKDFTTSIFINNIINNLDSLEANKEFLNCEVSDFYSFYQYIWIQSVKRFIKDINEFNVSIEIKDKIIKIFNINSNNRSIISYINNNYNDIFNKNNHTEVRFYAIQNILLDLIYNKFSKTINENVFLFLEKNIPITLILNFEICKNYYSKPEKEENFKSLFNDLESSKAFDDQIYLRFLCKTNGNYHKEFLREKASFICNRALNVIKQKGIDSDNKIIIQLANLLDEYLKLAKIFKLPCYADFVLYKNKIDKALDEYLHKHGEHLELGPISLQSVIDFLKKDAKPFSFLRITHSLKNNSYINKCNDIFDIEQKSAFSEVVGEYDNPRSDKYPYYKQKSMNLYLDINCQILKCILNDEKLAVDFSRYLVRVSNEVEQNYFNNDVKIVSEYLGIYEMINNLFSLYKNYSSDTPLIKALENGSCLILCGLIEKILRNVIIKELGNTLFIDLDAITLAQILNPNYELKDISKGLRYYLEYYLLSEINSNIPKEERPGKNIRNIQMHNRNGKYEKTCYNDVIILFYLALSILGDLVIKTLK